MPHSPEHMRTGANEARIDSKYAAKWGAEMGVPAQHVSGPDNTSWSGKVLGRQGNQLFFSAESTGGGASDSHAIEFDTSAHNDASFAKNFVGKQFNVEGKRSMTPNKEGGWSSRMDHSIYPKKD